MTSTVLCKTGAETGDRNRSGRFTLLAMHLLQAQLVSHWPKDIFACFYGPQIFWCVLFPQIVGNNTNATLHHWNAFTA